MNPVDGSYLTQVSITVTMTERQVKRISPRRNEIAHSLGCKPERLVFQVTRQGALFKVGEPYHARPERSCQKSSIKTRSSSTVTAITDKMEQPVLYSVVVVEYFKSSELGSVTDTFESPSIQKISVQY